MVMVYFKVLRGHLAVWTAENHKNAITTGLKTKIQI
jgi:hypothetical protein